jgi:hypothetical protein
VVNRYSTEGDGRITVYQGTVFEFDKNMLESWDKIKIKDTDAWLIGGKNEKGSTQIVFWRDNKYFAIVGNRIGKNDLIKIVESIE